MQRIGFLEAFVPRLPTESNPAARPGAGGRVSRLPLKRSRWISGPNGVTSKAEIIDGRDGTSRELSFTIPAAGEYGFVCGVHPSQMSDKVVAQ